MKKSIPIKPFWYSDVIVLPKLVTIITTLNKQGIINADYVICKRNGKPYTDISSAFDKAVQTAGIIDLRFHDLRHTFASNIVMLGGSIKGLQELLGHSNIIMTQRYSHLSEQSKKDIVCLLDEPDVEISRYKIGTVEENRHLQISASA